MELKLKQILRQDELGSNRKFWQTHVEAWRKSGKSRAEYCRLHDLSYDALTYWQTKTGAADPRRQEKTNPIVPVAEIPARQLPLRAATSPSSLTIDLKGRFRIEVPESFSPATLIRLIHTLEYC